MSNLSNSKLHEPSQQDKPRRRSYVSKRKKRDRERETGGKWIGSNSFKSVHVRNLCDQCPDAIAAKEFIPISTELVRMSLPGWDGIV